MMEPLVDAEGKECCEKGMTERLHTLGVLHMLICLAYESTGQKELLLSLQRLLKGDG